MRHTTTAEYDYEVAVVGGGPAGASAGVFCAREGLSTVIFDRGRSSLKRCAHLENYLGFPEGIDIETLYGLFHDQAETAGCTIVPDMVESLRRSDTGDGFVVALQDGEPTTARRVVAATRYDGSYMRGLGDDDEMFETTEYDGETTESFDRGYPNHDGTTPVPDLYVASPSEESQQAITAAGRGARVAGEVITDARVDDGWWEAVAEGVDWVRREAELDEEWADREAWVDWFDEYFGEDAPVDVGTDRYERVREAAIEDRLSSYIEPDERASRAETAHEHLADHLDPEAVVAGCDDGELLDAIADDRIAAYLHGRSAEVSVDGE
ncbi:FAD-dependent monooxygenase [Haloarcula salinisoli]|uniref:FAD-dependent monooxygenase n=1 Tax=Haloarcula salinisoli TaxID=2487746 RepID=A0A8J8CC39_9EURY|nr:FAD-dependent monooxygenase [Halomicroarcula salinisoli]MBX0305113.1 FAD-dependent monooxygenase [Halomicroarcula salinisoli]